jgi:hypothetical protein
MEKGIDTCVNVPTPSGSKPLNFDKEQNLLFEKGIPMYLSRIPAKNRPVSWTWMQRF